MNLVRASLIAVSLGLLSACGGGNLSNGGNNNGNTNGNNNGGTDGGGTVVEVCKNGLDDDGDGQTDCSDTECFGVEGCFATCVDLCSEGTTLCESGGVRTCEKLSDGCYSFGAATACDSSLVCSVGACVDTCTDACTEGAMACSGGAVVQCVKLSTGCTEWVNPTACPAGEICNGGTCVQQGACTNQCAEGATECTANGQQRTCVKVSSGCTEWTLPQTCPSEQTCPNSGNKCTLVPCTPGTTRCKGTLVESCDAQSNWIATQTCPQACQAGACTTAVACTPGAVRCNGSSVEICNSSGSAWLYNQTCNVGCSGGVCTDPCTSGDKRCNGDTPEVCNSTGTGWTATQSCQTSCHKGDCIPADLIIDGVTQTLEGEIVLQNSFIVRNGGQVVVGPSGALKVKAKTISIDAASSIVANNVGDETIGQGGTVQKCCKPTYCSGTYCSNLSFASSYGTTGTSASASVGCSSSSYYRCTNSASAPTYGRPDNLSIHEGSKHGTDLGGGLVSMIADSVTIDGDLTANGTAKASGGGILIAADTIKGNKLIQATGGSGGGGDGRVKLLRGATNQFTGTVVGVKADSVMPPLELVSGSHPDSNTWYNDGLGDWVIAWSRPFSTVNGYYYDLTTSVATLPSPSNGTFMQGEIHTVKADDLVAGTNYFHIISVDSAFNFGTVKNTIEMRMNSTPPSIASQTHPNAQWTANTSAYLTWTDPQAASNFTGYYYILDHYADTVPSATAGTFTTNPQLLLANLQPGIWVFHLVNRDTRGATTKKASHYKLYVGTEPAKGNVSGTVSDGDNMSAPLTGVTLKVNRGLFQTTTASNGTYTFNGNLYEGTWELTASAEGYQPQTKSITIVAGQPLTMNFTLTK